MVHDPRVTTLLSRLGGLYRDPARVDRDASSLLKSSVGAHLTPGIAPLVENNGDSSHCLVLQGTIAICFRGNTYQLLVDVYLPPGYPIRPPASYVRLAPNMYLKENHPHVGSDGMVYMPYTHEWNPRTHSLIEMVVAMSSVFSADPPVFTRTAAVVPPPPALQPYVSSSSTTSNSNPPPPTYSNAGFASPAATTAAATSAIAASNSNTDSDRYMREQMEAIMKMEADDANRAAEAARQAAQAEAAHAADAIRKAAKVEQDKQDQIIAQQEYQKQKQTQLQTQVNQKIHAHLANLAEQTKASVQSDWRDEQHLKQSKETSIQEQLDFLRKTKLELQQHITIVDAKTQDITTWLEESSNNSGKPEASVDDTCQPISKMHCQMLDLSTENAALTDALYFLDRGMYMDQMDCNTHLKSVRKLAKRQFLIRAHLIKINQVL